MDTQKEAPKMHRIQFEVNSELYERAKRYFKNDKFKGYFGMQSFETRVNYLEGRDKKLQTDRLKSDAKYFQKLIDIGEIRIK